MSEFRGLLARKRSQTDNKQYHRRRIEEQNRGSGHDEAILADEEAKAAEEAATKAAEEAATKAAEEAARLIQDTDDAAEAERLANVADEARFKAEAEVPEL